MTNNQITYKRLGEYIREVNVRNRELKVTRLMGLNMKKAFIPSVANVIGTDFSSYKIVRKVQFGCVLMKVGRDGISSIALLEDDEPIIISGAYYVFEVKDPNVLLPEYLMLWIRRPEFDRILWFKAGADVRGSVSFEAFCDMPIYVPNIGRQREIVSEYETLTHRIRLNEQMIEKLEATAQALYRHTFVDNIDKQNLPKGWHLATPISTPTSTPVNNLFTNSKLYTSNINILELVRVVGNEELSIKQMMENKGLKDRKNFLKYHLEPALKERFVRLKYPDRPNHPRQKYLLTVKGVALYNELTKGE